MAKSKYKKPEGEPVPPNCYKCRWRRPLPGDAHSRCAHPDITRDAITQEPINQLMAIFAGVGRVEPVVHASGAEHLDVKGNSHGIRSGWFNWPWNFDPTWLESCNGFEFIDTACRRCSRSAACLPVGKEKFKHKPDDCPWGEPRLI